MTALARLPRRAAEPLRLANGYLAAIETITPAARPLLEAALLRLSPESSRRRFFTPRFHLSERELAFLTSPDGVHHYALGVHGQAGDGSREGIATGRFVRLADDPTTAELAITVIDPFQRMGIGKALLKRLVAAAFARGIHRLRALLLPDNRPVMALLSKHAPSIRYAIDGELLRADIRLRD